MLETKQNQQLVRAPGSWYTDPMCSRCRSLQARVAGLAHRINRQKVWSAFQDQLRRGAYRNLLRGIMDHMYATGHEVDSLDVMLALGKRISK